MDGTLLWLIGGGIGAVLSCIALRRSREGTPGPWAIAWARAVLRHRWPITIAGLIVGIVSTVYAARLTLRTDPIVEIPTDTEMYKGLKRHDTFMGGLVLVTSSAFECLDELSGRLPASVAPQDEDFAAAQKYSLFLLSKDEAEVMDQSMRSLEDGGFLKAPDSGTFLYEYGRALVESSKIAISEGIGTDEELIERRVDEMGRFMSAVEEQMKGIRLRDTYPIESLVLSGRAAEWARGRGYIFPYPDGYLMNLRVTHEDVLEAARNETMVADLRAAMSGLNETRAGTGRDPCRFGLAGIAVNAGEAYKLIRSDLGRSLMIIGIISLLVIWLFMPRFSLAVVTLTGMGMAVLGAAALSYGLFGFITIGASVIFPVLLGVGDDLAYHVAVRVGTLGKARPGARTASEKESPAVGGVERENLEAMAVGLADLVQPTVWAGTLFALGGLTMLAVYYLGSPLMSLKEMGFLLSMGSALGVLVALSWMPAAIALIPVEWRIRKDSLRAWVVDRALDWVGEAAYRAVDSPRPFVAGAVILAALCVYPALHLKRELNVNRVVPEVEAFDRMVELGDRLGFWPVPSVVETAAGAALERAGGVARVDSFDLLFSGASGEAVGETYGAIRKQLGSEEVARERSIDAGLDRLSEGFAAVEQELAYLGLLGLGKQAAELGAKAIDLKRYAISPAAVERLDAMIGEGLRGLRTSLSEMSNEAPTIREFRRYYDPDHDVPRSFAYPKEAYLFDATPERMEAWTKTLGASGRAVPLEEGTGWAMRVAGRAFDRAFPAMLGLAFLLSWLASGSLRRALLVISLPLLGSLVAAAGVSWMDHRVDFANQWVWVMLVGLGIDDVVHLLHVGPRGIQKVVRPLFITSISTVLSGVVLMLSETQGYRTFGYAYFFGIGAMAFMSVFVYPAVLELIQGARRRAGETGAPANGGDGGRDSGQGAGVGAETGPD